MDNTETNRQDVDLISQLVTALEFNQRLLASSEKWFYGNSDDRVRARMQMLEHSIGLLTDLAAALSRMTQPSDHERNHAAATDVEGNSTRRPRHMPSI